MRTLIVSPLLLQRAFDLPAHVSNVRNRQRNLDNPQEALTCLRHEPSALKVFLPAVRNRTQFWSAGDRAASIFRSPALALWSCDFEVPAVQPIIPATSLCS